MTDQDAMDYVLITSKVMGITLEVDRANRVKAHLLRTMAMAKMLESADLSEVDEPAEIFCPKPH